MRRSTVVLLVIGLLAVSGSGVFRYMNPPTDIRWASAKLDAMEKQAKDLGIGLSLAEVDPRPKPGPSEDAAPGLARVHARVKSGGYFVKVPQWAKLLDGGRVDEVAKALQPLEGAMNEIESLAVMGRADFARALDNPSENGSRETEVCRRFAHLLSLRALVKASKGDKAGALKTLGAMYGLASLAGDSPSLANFFMQASCRSMTDERTVPLLAARWKDDAAATKALYDVVSANPYDSRFDSVLRYEAFFTYHWMRRYHTFSDEAYASADATESPVPLPSKATEADSRAFAARALEYWCDVWPRVKEDDVLGTVDAMDRKMLRVFNEKGLSYMPFQYVQVLYRSAGEAMVRTRVQHQLAQSLVASVLYKKRNGAFPKSATDLGEASEDGFARGKPLRFATFKGSFRVYSVGPNGKDDGGIAVSELSIKSLGMKERYDSCDQVAALPVLGG